MADEKGKQPETNADEATLVPGSSARRPIKPAAEPGPLEGMDSPPIAGASTGVGGSTAGGLSGSTGLESIGQSSGAIGSAARIEGDPVNAGNTAGAAGSGGPDSSGRIRDRAEPHDNDIDK